ncbi:hypothetical protein N7508_006915 [Penicillium antarcticum]|uniref:uncharacterized protein n=1 Tax=Penicillium antarcticum TaxID=416450 RepID=UPI00238E6A9D|nr:uncharacterized protein N7508_006915 [Penicillium antarcticum]KAJ5302052.1 hypothetical protein N7508_006915 [Penicillium antarcticum]
MTAPNSTEGSPADQLAAFSPSPLGTASQRAPARFPGMSTIRTSDPFIGFPSGVFSPGRSVRGTGLLHSRGASTSRISNLPDDGYPDTPARFSSARIGSSASAVPDPSGGGFNIPSPLHYSPAEMHHSSLPTHFTPGALYSPSQPGLSAYSPTRIGLSSSITQNILNRLLATSGNEPARLDPVLPAFPRSTSARSLTDISGVSLAARPLLTNDNQRGLTVYGIHINSTHWSVLEHFLVSCNASWITERVNADVLKPENYSSVDCVYLGDLQTRGRVSVLFTDLRDVGRAIDQLRNTHPEWIVNLASAREIADITKNVDIPSTANTNDGKLTVTVRNIGKRLTESYHNLVEGLIRRLGEVRSFQLFENGPVAQKYHVEFYNTRHAFYAFACLQGFKYEFLTFDASFNRPQDDTNRVFHPRTPSVSSQYAPMTPELVSSSSDTSSAVKGPKSENSIDMDRIQRGLDVRSTIMIRNIPNKVTSDQLKAILDESSFAKYDFMYLRMAHDSSSGQDLSMLANMIGNQRPESLSEKKAEISYATLQGKDALIAKFRNSHVMTRPISERPRLFHMGGPRSGSDAPFPPPNDANKLRRSVASTTQQGLYAPRSREAGARVSGSRTRSRARTQSVSQTPRSRRARGSVGQAMHNPDDSLSSSPMELDDDYFIKTN